MATPRLGRTPEEHRAHRRDQPHVVDRVARFLATIIVRLRRRILGTAEAPFGAIVPHSGEAGAWADAGAERTGSAAPAPTPPWRSRPPRSPGSGGSIPPRAERRLQHPQEAMHPLMGWALAPAAQSSLQDLEGIGLQVDQEPSEPILGCRQRAGVVGGVPTGGAWGSVETPCGHMGLEGGLTRCHQRPKRLQRETGHIQDLRRAGLESGEPSRAHGGGLLSLETKNNTNRDELYSLRHPPLRQDRALPGFGPAVS